MLEISVKSPIMHNMEQSGGSTPATEKHAKWLRLRNPDVQNETINMVLHAENGTSARVIAMAHDNLAAPHRPFWMQRRMNSSRR